MIGLTSRPQTDGTQPTYDEHTLGGTGMKRLVALIAGPLAGAAWAAATASPALAQTISLTPSSGTPGTQVTVSGSGFKCPRGASVSVSLDDETVATSTSARGTSFRVAFTVPGGTAPGEHAVRATVRPPLETTTTPPTTSGGVDFAPAQPVPCGSDTVTFTVSGPRPTETTGGSSATTRSTSTAADSEDGEGFPTGVLVGSAAAIAIVVILVLVALAFRRRTREPAFARPHAMQVPRLRTIEDPGSQVVESEPGRPLVAVRAMLDPAEISLLDEEHNDDNRL
jgi:hypothetical protein